MYAEYEPHFLFQNFPLKANKPPFPKVRIEPFVAAGSYSSDSNPFSSNCESHPNRLISMYSLDSTYPLTIKKTEPIRIQRGDPIMLRYQILPAVPSLGPASKPMSATPRSSKTEKAVVILRGIPQGAEKLLFISVSPGFTERALVAKARALSVNVNAKETFYLGVAVSNPFSPVAFDRVV